MFSLKIFLFPHPTYTETQQQKQKSRSIFHQFSPSLSEARLGSQHSNIVGCRNKYITYEEPSTFTGKKRKKDFQIFPLSLFCLISLRYSNILLTAYYWYVFASLRDVSMNFSWIDSREVHCVMATHAAVGMRQRVNVEGEKIISLMDTTNGWVSVCDRVHYICAEKKNKSQQSTHNFSLISANSISVWENG